MEDFDSVKRRERRSNSNARKSEWDIGRRTFVLVASKGTNAGARERGV